MQQSAIARIDRRLVAAVALLLALFVLFPYWQVIPLGMDIQPNALAVASVVAVGAWRLKMPLPILLLFGVSLTSILVLLAGPVDFLALRSAGNYVAVWLIAFAVFATLRNRDWLTPALLKWVIVTWFVVGAVQTFVDPYFLVDLVNPGARAAVARRGVVGLSTEPAHYASHCVLLFLLVQQEFKRKKLTNDEALSLQLLLVIQVVFFSRSSLGVLLLGTAVGASLMLNRKGSRLQDLWWVGVLLATVVGVVWALANRIGLEFGRLIWILGQLAADPVALLRVDGSANDRMAQVVGSVWATVSNGFFPHGFASWPDFVSQFRSRFGGFFWAMSSERIISGYGGALYHLGAVGLLIPIAITIAARRALHDWRSTMAAVLPLHVIMLVTAPLGKPTFALFIGYFAARSRRGGETDD